MKTKAFSLMEIIVVVAIIGILFTLITPQVRKYLASGKDVKAVSLLSNLRLASQMFQVENAEPLIAETDYDDDAKIKDALLKLESYLSPGALKYLQEGNIEIGGSKQTPTSKLIYGGKIGFTFKNPNALDGSDGVYIWFKLIGNTKEFDSKGTAWESY